MTKLGKEYWDARYRESQTGWDVGHPTTPLQQIIDALTDLSIRILIPGCGNAYEAEYLLAKGCTDITLIDIAPTVANKTMLRFEKEIKEGRIRVICGDFFEHAGQYDLILEQTFFCALPPELRGQYAIKMASLLAPQGRLEGVMFNFPLTEEGPPFGGNEAEYHHYFDDLFQMVSFHPCLNSIPPRAGRELTVRLVK